MRPLWLLTLLFMAVPLLAQTAPTPDAIISQENAFWKAYGNGNTTDLSKLLLPDFVNVEAEIWNRDQAKRIAPRVRHASGFVQIPLSQVPRRDTLWLYAEPLRRRTCR